MQCRKIRHLNRKPDASAQLPRRFCTFDHYRICRCEPAALDTEADGYGSWGVGERHWLRHLGAGVYYESGAQV